MALQIPRGATWEAATVAMTKGSCSLVKLPVPPNRARATWALVVVLTRNGTSVPAAVQAFHNDPAGLTQGSFTAQQIINNPNCQ
jgi:hypothetical protein